MLNWGVIGTGGIAYVFCNGMRFTDSGQIYAVASRTPSKADRFVNDFGASVNYSTYEELLADENVDAVYVSTIHPLHAEWAIKCAEAKKHILVEKPISMNAAETELMIQAARENDVFLMEAFMYRCHPQIQKMVDLIQEGAIGDVRVVRATFGFGGKFNPDSRTFNREMGGGGILDVGAYSASMARKVAGAVDGKPFLNPTSLKGHGKVGPTGVDHIATATVEFENGVLAEINCAVECNIGSKVEIYGSEGILTVPNPWLPSSPCRTAKEPLPADTPIPSSTLIVQPHRGGETREIIVEADRDLFTYEADMVANHIDDRQAPAMSWDDTLGNMQMLDAWLKEVGVEH